jgi:hypothetical protein
MDTRHAAVLVPEQIEPGQCVCSSSTSKRQQEIMPGVHLSSWRRVNTL